MAKLPDTFSLAAFPIECALSEGRKEDAKRLICELLREGKADRVVQRIAADMISNKPRKRGRPKSQVKHWLDIGEEFHSLRGDGVKYEDALLQLSEKFGYSETNIRNAVHTYDEARRAHDEATAEYYD